MSEAKFTSGEWSVLGEIVIAKDGAVVIKPLASGQLTPQEDEANAHLIAAAPEMYEMLESLAEAKSSDKQLLGFMATCWINNAEKLLAKARGEQ